MGSSAPPHRPTPSTEECVIIEPGILPSSKYMSMAEPSPTLLKRAQAPPRPVLPRRGTIHVCVGALTAARERDPLTASLTGTRKPSFNLRSWLRNRKQSLRGTRMRGHTHCCGVVLPPQAVHGLGNTAAWKATAALTTRERCWQVVHMVGDACTYRCACSLFHACNYG